MTEQMIYTKDGLVSSSLLEVIDVIEWHDNARVTATEWRRNGEIVRRDVNVNMLRGLEMGAAQSNL